MLRKKAPLLMFSNQRDDICSLKQHRATHRISYNRILLLRSRDSHSSYRSQLWVNVLLHDDCIWHSSWRYPQQRGLNRYLAPQISSTHSHLRASYYNCCLLLVNSDFQYLSPPKSDLYLGKPFLIFTGFSIPLEEHGSHG